MNWCYKVYYYCFHVIPTAVNQTPTFVTAISNTMPFQQTNQEPHKKNDLKMGEKT